MNNHQCLPDPSRFSGCGLPNSIIQLTFSDAWQCCWLSTWNVGSM